MAEQKKRRKIKPPIIEWLTAICLLSGKRVVMACCRKANTRRRNNGHKSRLEKMADKNSSHRAYKLATLLRASSGEFALQATTGAKYENDAMTLNRSVMSAKWVPSWINLHLRCVTTDSADDGPNRALEIAIATNSQA